MSGKVYIGMPVYNEEKYIAKTIESILNQDFSDFNLIISDNCSIDRTFEICQHYASKDNRITLIRNPSNIGAPGNSQQVVDLSAGDYFVWISGHDLWHPQFLSKSVALMDSDPDVVLCHSRSTWIDDREQHLGTIGRGIETRGLDLVSRFQIVLWAMGYGCTIYGLIRQSALKKLTLGTKTIAIDNIFLNELSIFGSFAYIDEPLHYVRKLGDYGSWESYIEKIFNQKLSDFSASYLFWTIVQEYLRIIYKHINNSYFRNILANSVVSCIFSKHHEILLALDKSGVTQQIDRNKDPYWQNINCLLATINNSSESIESLWTQVDRAHRNNLPKMIAIDGVFYQLFNTGIGRVWQSLLEEWANTEFGDRLIVIDRAGTAPRVAGISYYRIPAYNYQDPEGDRQMLQQICDEIGAELFISTYYSTPLETPSVFMGYDMIPEVMGWNLSDQVWQDKKRAIESAEAHITISGHTAKDLVEIYPDINPDAITVAHCGVPSFFKQRSTAEVNNFRHKYGVSKPYFILIGSFLGDHKNGILFWQAFSQIEQSGEFEVICTGAAGMDADRTKEFAPNTKIHHLYLEEDELNAAYAGAIALVYPSKYEGFGLPIVEAFASGCPVVTCPNASIPEVAGAAAIYVKDDDVAGMVAALLEVQKPEVRLALTALGSEQVRQFTWSKMADIIKSVLLDRTLAHLSLSDRNLIIFPDWTQDETELGEEISMICYNLAANPEFDRPTLIIDTSRAEDIEIANMLISGVAMNLMMAAEIDITEHLEIALTGEIIPIQWQQLLPKLTGKITLEREDLKAIELAQVGSLPEINAIELSTLVEA